ncbi:MAG: cupredoxin domain-containing protein [Candidatus Vogelbacteria bacterium]|nr:cupredoxin domain-containing protein [Candidatus Vogelbacteria bacterium]
MTLDNIIVIIAGIVGIVFVYWFFLLKKEKIIEVSDIKGKDGFSHIDITVEGGYTPEAIAIPLGEKTVLDFTRTDPSSCLEEVVLGDFNVRRELPLHKKVSIEITPKTKGTFIYSCGMNMYHGKIIVE